MTIQDTTPPLLIVGTNKTVVSGAAWDFDNPTASDLSGVAVIAIIGTVTNGANLTRTWSATDAAGNTSDWSPSQSLYLDVTEPIAPFIDSLPTSNVSVDLDGSTLTVFNRDTFQNGQKAFKGHAEPGSKVTLTVFDSLSPPGVLVKTVMANAVDGSWSVVLSQQEWQGLSEGVIACKVKATDASGNISRESDPQRFYMDITPPADPVVELSDSVVLRVNPQQATIRFLNLDDFQNGTWIDRKSTRLNSSHT